MPAPLYEARSMRMLGGRYGFRAESSRVARPLFRDLCPLYEAAAALLSNSHAGARTSRGDRTSQANQQGRTAMTILVSQSVAAGRNRSIGFGNAPQRRLPAIGAAALYAGRATVLLLCSVASAASSIAFLASIGIVMPIVTEQVGGWLQGGHWHRAPVGGLMSQIGYPPQFDASPIGSIANWCLSGESALLIVVAGAAFAWSVWMLEVARVRLFVAD